MHIDNIDQLIFLSFDTYIVKHHHMYKIPGASQGNNPREILPHAPIHVCIFCVHVLVYILYKLSHCKMFINNIEQYSCISHIMYIFTAVCIYVQFVYLFLLRSIYI